MISFSEGKLFVNRRKTSKPTSKKPLTAVYTAHRESSIESSITKAPKPVKVSAATTEEPQPATVQEVSVPPAPVCFV